MKFWDWLGVVGIAATIAWVANDLLEVHLDNRLDDAWHERRELEARIDSIIPTPEPTLTRRARGAATATSGPTPTSEPMLRETDIWPELAYDGVIDAGCRGVLATRYPDHGLLHQKAARRLRNLGNDLSYVLEYVQDANVRSHGDDCAEAQEQIQNFLTLRQESRSRWREAHWLPYPGARFY